MKIMLDPGHSGDYFNSSPVVDGYYESRVMWSFTEKLKVSLEEYGFEVALSREYYEDPELTERGRRAAGCDLFLSLHSNAAASEEPDAPWLIHFASDGGTDLDERSKAAAQALGPVISRVMGVSEPFYYTKKTDFDRDGNGRLDDEWYGVLYGAKSVGVPGVIAEHSFHTNRRAAEWLMSDENLRILAEAEAEVLALLYGMEKKMTEAERKKLSSLEEKLLSLEEKVEGHNEQVGIKWAYLDGNLPDWAAPTVKRLVESGSLMGNGEGSLELSYLMLRLLVILDREGLFE